MIKETKYGIISDVHSDPRMVPVAIDVLKSQGAERLLINGDIGNQQRNLQESQNYVAFILDSIAQSGLESFVQPGSHETLLSFGPVLNHFAEKHSNIIDATKNRKIEQEGHDLVFLSGSDFLCGGEYQIGCGEIKTGDYYLTVYGELLPLSTPREELQRLSDMGKLKGMLQYNNLGDLKRLVTSPEKTIVVCHVPRKFDNLETAVDVAEFGFVEDNFDVFHVEYKDGKQGVLFGYSNESNEEFQKRLKQNGVLKILKHDPIPNGAVFPIATAKSLGDLGEVPISLRKENRGNEDLKGIYEELGITKAVSGHFHESGHRANDRNGNHVQEGKNVRELFWNSGYLDVGQTGILTVSGDEISYQNIQLKN